MKKLISGLMIAGACMSSAHAFTVYNGLISANNISQGNNVTEQQQKDVEKLQLQFMGVLNKANRYYDIARAGCTSPISKNNRYYQSYLTMLYNNINVKFGDTPPSKELVAKVAGYLFLANGCMTLPEMNKFLNHKLYL